MRKWPKRIRGAVGMGLTGAAAGSGLGAMLGLVNWVYAGGASLLADLIGFVAIFAVAGFLSGAALSRVLAGQVLPPSPSGSSST